MSIMIVAALMMAQAPAAAQQAPSLPTQPKTQKPPQICEYLEITGSRSKRRVCRDANGDLDLGPGVSHSAFGKGQIDQQQGLSGASTTNGN
jgi:hypothetical protein